MRTCFHTSIKVKERGREKGGEGEEGERERERERGGRRGIGYLAAITFRVSPETTV